MRGTLHLLRAAGRPGPQSDVRAVYHAARARLLI